MIWIYLVSLILLLFDFFILRHYGNADGKALRLWMIIVGIIIFAIPIVNIVILVIYTLTSPLLLMEYRWIPIENNKWNKFVNWLNKEI